MQNWDVALEDLNRLKETIESTVSFCVGGQLNLWGIKFYRSTHNFVGAVKTSTLITLAANGMTLGILKIAREAI